MQYNFDEVINRYNTNSVKWDFSNELFDEKDILPLSIADMDFKSPQPVIDELKKVVEQGIYGYAMMGDSYYESVVNWMKKRHDWEIKKDWVIFTPRISVALSLIIKNMTNPGDEVIVQVPGYEPLREAAEGNGCKVIESPLKQENGRYVMDFEDIEKKINPNVKMFILCNPHNPVGRVWTKNELIKLGNICFKHDILVISDEIHSDIIYEGNKHTPFAAISEEFANKSIICTSVAKSFNLPGVLAANIIIANPKLRINFEQALDRGGVHNPNVFGVSAVETAYNYGEEWLNELIVYLQENVSFLTDYIEKNINGIKVIRPEGTFLVWMDCRGLCINSDEMKDLFLKKAKVGVMDGSHFGCREQGFVRINIACPRSVLKEALDRIKEAVISLNA